MGTTFEDSIEYKIFYYGLYYMITGAIFRHIIAWHRINYEFIVTCQ